MTSLFIKGPREFLEWCAKSLIVSPMDLVHSGKVGEAEPRGGTRIKMAPTAQISAWSPIQTLSHWAHPLTWTGNRYPYNPQVSKLDIIQHTNTFLANSHFYYWSHLFQSSCHFCSLLIITCTAAPIGWLMESNKMFTTFSTDFALHWIELISCNTQLFPQQCEERSLWTAVLCQASKWLKWYVGDIFLN